MGLSLDLVEVGWAAAVAAEGRELPATTKQLLGRLVPAAVLTAHDAVSALDPEQVSVCGARTFQLGFEEFALLVSELAEFVSKVLPQLALIANVGVVVASEDATATHTL